MWELIPRVGDAVGCCDGTEKLKKYSSVADCVIQKALWALNFNLKHFNLKMGETLALHASERQGTSTYLSEHDRDQPYFALTSKVILMCRFTFFFLFFVK